MYRKKTHLHAVLWAVMACCGSGFAQAAPPPIYELNPIVVTAQRSETSDLSTPASVEVITAEQLQDTGMPSVFEALSHVTGFNGMSWGGVVQDYGMSTGRITMRGFDKGTLVMVNGAPMNLLNYNTAAGIPVNAVERIEVVKGASSVLYGSEAMAGVVNIITKKPIGTSESTVGASYGNYASDWNAGIQSDHFSLYYRRQFADSISQTDRPDIYKYDKELKQYVLSDQHGLDKGKNDNLFLTLALSDRLNLNWNYYNQESNRTTYKGQSLTRATDYRYNDIRNNVNLIYDDQESGLRSVWAYNKRRAHADKYIYSSGLHAISERYDMYSWTTDTQKTWRFRNGKDTLIGGFTFSRENYRGLPKSTATVYNSAHRNNISLYALYTTELSPKFAVTMGLRGERSDDYAKSKNILLPQFQTLYRLSDHASWFVNVGRSFQMPALNQYFSKAGYDFNALKPQQGWTYETGVKWITDDASFKVYLYHMNIKDSFKWKKNPDNTDYMANGGTFRNTGIEADYTKRINDFLSYNVGASFSNPEDNESGSWKQNNARLQYTAGLTYDKEKWTANISYVYLGDRQTSNYYRQGGIPFSVPSRMDLSANVRYRPNSQQVISLTLDNILDRENSVNMYENLGLPFNWLLSWQLSF